MKIEGSCKCRLAQAFPSPCPWQWSTAWAEHLPQALSVHRAGPRCPTLRWPQELCRTALMEPQHSAGQGQSSSLNWSHTCNSAALLHTTLHLGKKTHLHCCFLFCLLTHFFKNIYQTLFWYLGKSNKMWINTLWKMLSIKQLHHNFLFYKRFLMEFRSYLQLI